MTKRELVRAVQKDVKDGKDRRQVFETYKEQFPKPVHLAAAIAGIAKAEERKKYQGLNLVLVVLLVLAGLLKAVGVWVVLSASSMALAGVLSLISLLVPLAFAFEVNRFTGGMYGLLTILCGMGMVNILARFQGDFIGTGIDFVLLGAIMALSIVLRKKLFPGLKLLSVKTDGSGTYVLG